MKPQDIPLTFLNFNAASNSDLELNRIFSQCEVTLDINPL